MAAITTPVTGNASGGSDVHNLQTLWNQSYQKFQRSRLRIAEAGMYARNEVEPHVPVDWVNADAFKVMLPYATEIGQKVTNFLGKRNIKPRRQAVGSGPSATRLATKIEQYLSSCTKQLKTNGASIWTAILSAAVNDGEGFVLVCPRPKHWSSLVSFIDEQTGEIHARFHRDSKSRKRSDDGYEGVSERSAARAYFDYARDSKARALPFVVRVVPASMCLPLGVGQDGSVEAVLIRSRRSVLSVRAEGLDIADPVMRQVVLGPDLPVQDNLTYGSYSAVLEGAGRMVTLYELWTGDGKVWYQLGDGMGQAVFETTYRGNEAVVDLKKEYGIDRLPGHYFYGAHWPNETDPDKRGIPILSPYLSSIAGLNQITSAVVFHAYSFAFGGLAIVPGKDIPIDLWTEHGKPLSFKIEPMKAQYVAGEPHPMVHEGVNKDVGEIMKILGGRLDLASSQSPGSAETDSSSGFAQGVSMATSEHLHTQILAGAEDAMRAVWSNILWQTAAIAEKTGAPVPVYNTIDQKGDSHTYLELSEDDLDGVFDIDSVFEHEVGEDLAKAQAGYTYASGPLKALSLTTYQQKFLGIEDPEAEQTKIMVEEMLQSPQGQQIVFETAARLKGEKELAQLYKLQQQGQASPGGLPTSALPPGAQQGQGGPGGIPVGGGTGQDKQSRITGGPGSGNPAQAALAGITSGASMTKDQAGIVAATGRGAPVSV